MRIFKFGGGTLKDTAAIRKMTEIVRSQGARSGDVGAMQGDKSSEHGQKGLVVVVSAFNKMTNAFELLYDDIRQGRNYDIKPIMNYHRALVDGLFAKPDVIWNEKIEPEISRLMQIISVAGAYSYDQGYDQVVSFGEILSTTIISAFWEQEGLLHNFLDVRRLIITDSRYRAARVDWNRTSGQILQEVQSSAGQADVYLSQGFIAGTGEGMTTTLGREGSDYSSAIFGSVLDVDEVVIWKDVPGVLNADPAQFDDTEMLDEISYLEAVELSYFGAKVIHPNTIKPLHNKGVPLIVKSIFSPDDRGTIVSANAARVESPVFIRKEGQVLVSIQPRDFSFIIEDAMAEIFSVLAFNNIRINLMQHGAVSLSLVFNMDQKKLDVLLDALLPNYKVLYNTGLELLTIRHYTSEAIEKFTGSKRIYVQQQSRATARFVLG